MPKKVKKKLSIKKVNGSVAKKVMHGSAKSTRGGSIPSTTSRKKTMEFIEESHQYRDGDERYTPVSTLLKAFEQEKDWDEICRNKAIKLGRTFEDLKAEWGRNNKAAIDRGNKFHRQIEKSILEGDGKIIDYKPQSIVSAPTIGGIKKDESVKLEEGVTYPEKMIWSKKYKVCGTADLVEVRNGYINIKDYKTNSKLDTSSYKDYKTGESDKMKYPLHNLDDCNFNHYQLQLNLYMFLLLQSNKNLKMGTMTILHVGFDTKGKPTSMMPYKVKNLQLEVKAMLEQYNKTKKK